jgi:hypothetical protein
MTTSIQHTGDLDRQIAAALHKSDDEPYADALRIHVLDRDSDGNPTWCRVTVYAPGRGFVAAEHRKATGALAEARRLLGTSAVRSPR